MNTALYCTSTAPTDTYYTHTNLGKAGELRPSLRPRSAAGRRLLGGQLGDHDA